MPSLLASLFLISPLSEALTDEQIDNNPVMNPTKTIFLQNGRVGILAHQCTPWPMHLVRVFFMNEALSRKL
jgi:hypothetical protein